MMFNPQHIVVCSSVKGEINLQLYSITLLQLLEVTNVKTLQLTELLSTSEQEFVF